MLQWHPGLHELQANDNEQCPKLFVILSPVWLTRIPILNNNLDQISWHMQVQANNSRSTNHRFQIRYDYITFSCLLRNPHCHYCLVESQSYDHSDSFSSYILTFEGHRPPFPLVIKLTLEYYHNEDP